MSMIPYERYHKLKIKGKELRVDYDRLSRELEKSRKILRKLRKEKEKLLDRICTYEQRKNNISSDSDSNPSSDEEETENGIQNNNNQHHQIHHNHNRHQKFNGTSIIKGSRGKSFSSTLVTSSITNSISANTSSTRRSTSPAPAANNIVNTSPISLNTKKRASKKPLNTKTMKVQYVEKDEKGNYKLPVQVGILTVLDLGHVVYDREAFHNDRYVFPVGYTIRRSYNSMIDSNNQTMYTCKIEDGGSGPKFIIEPDDQPGKQIIANTATGAWTTVVREANAIRQRNHSNSASGPDYYGFSQATIRKMIQDLPNAAKCKNYLLQSFEVMKSRNGVGGSGNKRRRNNSGNGGGGNVDIDIDHDVDGDGDAASATLSVENSDAGGGGNKRRRVNGVGSSFSIDNSDFGNGNRSDGTINSQNTVY